MLIKLTPIKGHDGFQNVYMAGKKFYTKQLTAVVIFADNANITAELSSHTINYGVTIGKRLAHKAVIRNRVKRLLRHSMRTLMKEIDNSKLIIIDKIILSYKIAPAYPKQIGLTDVMPAIKQALEQAYLFYSRSRGLSSASSLSAKTLNE